MMDVLLVISILIPFLGGFIIAKSFRSAIDSWYKTLKKPSFNPPNWVFAPVWSVIYICIGYSSYLVYSEGGGFYGPAKIPLLVYGVTIAINWSWTPIFFHFHNLKLAFYVSSAMWLSIIATMVTFNRISTTAALLHLPFLLWVSFATFLSYNIWQLNKDAKVK